MESMKMEIPVEADDAGIVKEIKVAENDNVDDGHVLIILE
jgi:acetyl-CoA carboxylase biotin carboxyl carrier protein